jgi:hypothetical protein
VVLLSHADNSRFCIDIHKKEKAKKDRPKGKKERHGKKDLKSKAAERAK